MRSVLLLITLLFAATAQGLDFKSIGAAPAIMYDAPSAKGAKVYVAPRGMPVEVVLTYGTWSKVRDMSGDLSWVESKDLIERRNVIVRVANARVYSAADENSGVVMTADKFVLLEMAEPANGGWVKVRHRDGQIGYVKLADVWGL